QAAFFEFVYDDFGQIVYNPWIKSRHLIFGYFTTHVWAQSGGLALYYRPVYMLWLGANYAIFGLNPLYWHLAAIFLHLVSCLLLYFLVYRLTLDYWVAVVSVLLFGLHPAHLESVAWVSGTKELLMASLLLGPLLCYLKGRGSVKTRTVYRLVGSLLLALIAVFVKETALILPTLIFSYEWIFHQRETTQKVRFWSAIRAA